MANLGHAMVANRSPSLRYPELLFHRISHVDISMPKSGTAAEIIAPYDN